jgi:hypothetical protein
MPERIGTSLLVLQPFKSPDGFEWREGDRAPLHQRTVRRAALEHPDWFAVEFETAPVDLDWLRELDAKYEADLDALKRRRGEQKAREERALREEYETQDKPDSEQRRLERAYEKQEQEREREKQRLSEERERQGLERELAFGRGGYHFDR